MLDTDLDGESFYPRPSTSPEPPATGKSKDFSNSSARTPTTKNYKH